MSSKQQKRKEQKVATKKDDEPAVASTTSQAALVSAGKELFLNSVLADVGPQVPKLMSQKSSASVGSDDKPEETAEATTSDANDGTVAPPPSLASLDSLGKRLTVSNPLGIDKAPAESWNLLLSQEVDFGPHKRKKGNAAMERMMVNLERNMVPYLHILLLCMCLRTVLMRSWFACLPWLLFYQFLVLNVPVSVVAESVPAASKVVDKIEDKHLVTSVVSFNGLVWLFFLYEFGYETYFLEKLLIIALFAAHAYIAAPHVDVEAARKKIAEEASNEEPAPSTGKGPDAKENWRKVKANIKDLVVVKQSRSILGEELPAVVKELKAKKSNGDKTDAAEEKKEDDEKKTNGDGAKFQTLQKQLSRTNVLGLFDKSEEDAKQSWKTFGARVTKYEAVEKKKGAAKDRILTNFQAHMFEYAHIMLFLMCLRGIFIRSWFALLPILVGCQVLSLTTIPQLEGKVDIRIRAIASQVLHVLVWFFFVYEFAFMSHFIEKVLMAAMFAGHAFFMAPSLPGK
jgi:hypothetical protein